MLYMFYIGTTVWTKLIRNNTAVQYLFDADTFDFNYQFNNRLPERIQLYPVRKSFKSNIIGFYTYNNLFRVMHLLLSVFIVLLIKMKLHWFE